MVIEFEEGDVQVIGILILIDVSLINGTEIWLGFGDFGEGG